MIGERRGNEALREAEQLDVAMRRTANVWVVEVNLGGLEVLVSISGV